MSKISIIGAGNVGTACADYLLTLSLVDELVLIDIKPGLAEGKALDLSQKGSLIQSSTTIEGVTGEYAKTKDSDVVVITSGARRQAQQSRSDILAINASIIAEVTQQVLIHSPACIIIMVSNPLDVMCYHALQVSNIDPCRIIGMAGILDAARFKAYIARELTISPSDIDTILLGGHGDTMVPLPRHTTVKGKPLHETLSSEQLQHIIQKTKDGGAEITALMETSAYFCPGTAAAYMVKAIIHDEHSLYPCSCHVQGQYGLHDLYIGLPVLLGKSGIEKIVSIDLTPAELDLLHVSATHIRKDLVTLQSLT